MGIYNSKGFNWERYEVIPEKTHAIWFENDPYTEITFREFITIIAFFYSQKVHGKLDTLSIKMYEEILQKLYKQYGEEKISGLPYSLKYLKDNLDIEIQYISPGLIMSTCLYFSLFYLGKQQAEVYGYKNSNNENCVFETLSKIGSPVVRSVLNYIRPNNNMESLKDVGVKRIKGEQTVYNRYISSDENHIYKQLKGFICKNINDDDVAQLKKLIDCFYPEASIAGVINSIKVFQGSEEDVLQVMETIRDKCYELEDEIAEKVFKALTSSFTMEKPKYWAIAIGDGENTSSILGLKQFGLLLFNYGYYIPEGQVKTNYIHSIVNEPLNKNELLHIDSLGVDNNNIVKCVLTIRPKNGGSVCQKEFSVNTDGFALNDEECFYKNNDNREFVVTKFRKSTNDFYFYEDCIVDIEFITDVNGHEDAMFFVSKIKDYRNTESLLYYNTFESAEFSLTDLKMRDLYNANKDVFDDIAKKVRDGFTIEPNLTGEFVGKPAQTCMYSDKDVEADKDYRLGYEGSTIIDEGLDNENLRMSRVVIKTDFENKKLMVNIVSHTSPRKVNLTLTESEYENDWGAISHNQVLAMLRSMGMFEAICFILYSLSINVDIKEKIKRTLNYSCVCDKTGTSRDIPCLNIKKNIKYNDFLKIDGDTERIIKELNLN